MTGVRRRDLLAGAMGGGVLLGAGAVPASGFPGPLAVKDPDGDSGPPGWGPVTITPEDLRYPSLLRGDNHRFVPRPDTIQLVTTTGQVAQVVGAAVAAGKRIVVRGGGHGFENFAASPEIRSLVHLSPMARVSYDPWRCAVVIEAGATLGQVYHALFTRWGVTLPGGDCPAVGVGGHFAGGGFGPLSRVYGAVVDYLDAVEMVVVDPSGEPRVIMATRDPGDEHRELWWAHTGGGGGTMGVVTRYWLRGPASRSAATVASLPPAPARMRLATAEWSWRELTETGFTTLIRNVGAWYEATSGPRVPERHLFTIVNALHRSGARLTAQAVINDGVPGAGAMVTAYFKAIAAGVGSTPKITTVLRPWLEYATPAVDDAADSYHRRYKIKCAYHQKAFTERQLRVLYRHLQDRDYTNPRGHVVLLGHGGLVNTVPSDATAVAQRSSVFMATYATSWGSEREDAVNVDWLRRLYREVYADTGGVPGLDGATDGSYINYPDVDLADPDQNTTPTPWHRLYYKDNYPRLQRVKRRYDPGDVFRHALSIRPPDTAGTGR